MTTAPKTEALEGVREEIEAVIACLGDDAAELHNVNPECEVADNMLRAAELLELGLADFDPLTIARHVCRSVAEIGDRNSPEGQPDMMLVTADELFAIVIEAFAENCPPAAPRSAAPGWMPIETAPQAGELVLLGAPKGVWLGKYKPVYGSGYRPENPWSSMLLNHDHMAERYTRPTHWMPLPAPPSEGGKQS